MSMNCQSLVSDDQLPVEPGAMSMKPDWTDTSWPRFDPRVP